MAALIRGAESQGAIKNMFELMTKKIEERILNEKPVILCVNNGFFECKTTVKLDTYEVDEIGAVLILIVFSCILDCI